MKEYTTDQERFWAGQAGTDYVSRNEAPSMVAASTAMFGRSLARAQKLGSAIEFGANLGLNLRALRNLFPSIELAAIEINGEAARRLREIPGVKVHEGSILEFEPERTYDLALIRGVLIHIAPASLEAVYQRLYRSTHRYLMVAEYYNPTPVELPYRGERERLFKRDFAGELMDRYPDLRLVDYGFVYRRDPVFPQDDITWFLMEKSGRPEQERP